MLILLQSMTAHVSACPNHQVGRNTPLKTRGLIAMSASFGYELNPLTFTAEEREQVARQVRFYKQTVAPLVVEGDFTALSAPLKPTTAPGCLSRRIKAGHSPFTRGSSSVHRCAVSASKCRGWIRRRSITSMSWTRTLAAIRLMYAGLTVPVLEDFEAVSYTLTRV